MATTYLTRAQVAGNRQTFTQSFWVKLSNTTDQGLISSFNDSTSYSYCYIDSSTQQLQLQWKSGSVVAQLNTNRKFRDTSGWYNIIYAVDTTQSTDSDRIKLYINGVQETSFSTATYPGQILSEVNDNGTTQYIGSVDGTQQYVNGSMSYVAQIDGTQELPGIFGETDSTTGEWKIKTTITPSVAWGNNGFLILKNGNSVTDQSGKGNNFTLGGGTLTNTKDCPDNVFATWNASIGNMDTLTNGNTTVARSGSGWRGAFSSLPLPTTGKFYCEFKISSGSNLADLRAGIADDSFDGSIDLQNRGQVNQLGEQTNGISYTAGNGNADINGTTTASYGSAISTSNVLGMAVDMTNMKLYFSKDGVFQNSGDPTSGATGTGALAIPATLGKYFVAVGVNTSAWHVNFGNGTFGTTAITSAGTPGSTPGEFEYDVPTGYQPLTTKGLNA